MAKIKWPWRREEKALDQSNDRYATDASTRAFIRGEGFGYVNVSPRSAYYYYASVSSLADAVGKIATRAAALTMQIGRGTDTVEDHDFLSLINSRVEGFSAVQGKTELLKSFLLTEDAWVVLRGNVSRPPLSYTFIRPYAVDVTYSSVDGLPTIIRTDFDRDRRTYRREETNAGIRYIDEMGLNEIVPIIGEVQISDEWRGESKLSALISELNQVKGGNRHNESLLQNGAKPSMIVSPKQPTAGQTEGFGIKEAADLQDAFRRNFQGAGNAGNVAIIGKPVDVNSAFLSNTDMDYINLLRNNSYAVYNRYNVPLALISPETMTLDNYKQATQSLYTEAVFPAFDYVFGALLQAVKPRYPDLANSYIRYNDLDVRALRSIHIDQMVRLKDTEAVSINEIRSQGGFEDLPDGNAIMIGANKIPLGVSSESLIPEDQALLDDDEDDMEMTT